VKNEPVKDQYSTTIKFGINDQFQQTKFRARHDQVPQCLINY
jgi:hypothetical protein